MNAPVSARRLAARLADPALLASLSHFVRARVPGHAVNDIVQATLADALASTDAPDDDDEIAPWVHGICRHKVVDWFRGVRREVLRDPELTDESVAGAESVPQTALDLLRWARKELPEGEEHQKTFEWMLREGEGEKLETIAAEAKLPAPRVRQRVSRLRRYYRARWAAQAAALAALLVVAVVIALALRKKKETIAPLPSPSFVPAPMPRPLPPERPAASVEPPVPSVVPSVAPSLLPLAPVPSASSLAPPRVSRPPRPISTTAVPPAPAKATRGKSL